MALQPPPVQDARRHARWAGALAGCVLLALLVPTGAGNHPTPPCFDEHGGPHQFPLTGATARIEFENNAALGPYSGQSVDLEAAGPTVVEATPTSPTHMDTQIVEMDLVGFVPGAGPVEVSVSTQDPSLGTVDAFSATQCYPAQSVFDVFVEVRAPPAHAHDPKHMEATLHEIPPAGGDFYEDPATILLYSGPAHPGGPPPGEFLVGRLMAATHVPTPACSDGLDNDGDTDTDFPADGQCDSPTDNSEASQCSDGLDNDGDSQADFPADTGCSSATDDSESPNPQCSDGADNDGDTFVDYPADSGCTDVYDDSEVSGGPGTMGGVALGPVSAPPSAGAGALALLGVLACLAVATLRRP